MSDKPTNRRSDPFDDPFDDFRKKMREDPLLGPFFQDIDREFERMRDSLTRMMQDMSQGAMEPGKDPFVYGFSLRMGPDGKPKFQEFGNVKPLRPSTTGSPLGIEEAREPLVDVQDGDKHITITVELPGVERDDVNVRAKERELVIRVDAPARKYFKRIDLPAAVKPETTRATYKNGVLDIEVDKAHDADEGTTVEVG